MKYLYVVPLEQGFADDSYEILEFGGLGECLRGDDLGVGGFVFIGGLLGSGVGHEDIELIDGQSEHDFEDGEVLWVKLNKVDTDSPLLDCSDQIVLGLAFQDLLTFVLEYLGQLHFF